MEEEAQAGDWQGRVRARADGIGHLLTEGFHLLALFAIGAATVWSAGEAFLGMAKKGHASIEDLLLLFIYLEIGSMVGVYFKTNHMPLRFVLYVAITALTRHLIGFVNHEPRPDNGLLILGGSILLLSIAVLMIRYASFHYGTSPGVSMGLKLTDSDTEARDKRR